MSAPSRTARREQQRGSHAERAAGEHDRASDVGLVGYAAFQLNATVDESPW